MHQIFFIEVQCFISNIDVYLSTVRLLVRIELTAVVMVFLGQYPRYINFFKPFQSWPVNHLVVPIGVSHISLRHKKYNQGSGRKRTKNKRTIRAWVNSSARRVIL